MLYLFYNIIPIILAPILLIDYVNTIREDFCKPKFYDRNQLINYIINYFKEE